MSLESGFVYGACTLVSDADRGDFFSFKFLGVTGDSTAQKQNKSRKRHGELRDAINNSFKHSLGEYG